MQEGSMTINPTEFPVLVEFLGPRHPIHRVHPTIKEDLIRTQQSIITRAFPTAYDFCARVLDDLKLNIHAPDSLKQKPVTDLADMSFADLKIFFNDLALMAGIPDSSAQLHAFNSAQRAQLVRAFDSPDLVIEWATQKAIAIITDLPHTARDIEVGRNPGDVLDPYLLTATQSLLCQNDFRQAISATVAHKALMILEGLLGHLHEEVVGRMRGNLKNPEPRGDNAELFDFMLNPFPGADVIQPPQEETAPLRLHQVKSKTGTLNSSGGARLAEQMRRLRMTYPGAELYSHSLVGNTLSGHRSMGGMLRVEPSLIVVVGDASFQVLTGSSNGGELILRLYQTAFHMAATATGYNIEDMTTVIVETFRERAFEAGEGFLETVLHQAIRGNPVLQDSRTYPRRTRYAV
jgi:hypothetical protein